MNMQNNVPASVRAFLAKIGNQLKTAREQKNLSREDVCRGLKIHINFLIALEEGLFEDLPGANSFFASLRTYSKFLGLDTERIITECKKNSFLFQALQGEGIIERPQSKLDIKINTDQNNLIPESLEKLEINENKESFESENTEKVQEQANKKKIVKKSKLGLLFFILLIIFVLSAVFMINREGWMNKTNICNQFIIKVKEETDIKILALSMNQPLLDRTVSEGEEIKLSDSKGLKISIINPNSIELKKGYKTISIKNLPKENGFAIIKCN